MSFVDTGREGNLSGRIADVVLNLRTPKRAVTQAVAVLAGVVLVADLSDWPPWLTVTLCLVASVWSAVFRSPIRLQLVPGGPAGRPATHIEVVRWGRRTLYSLDEMTMTVYTFRVSVPVCHLVFRDGRSLGPMLVSDDSARFMREITHLVRSQDHDRDAVSWSHVMELERYLDRVGY